MLVAANLSSWGYAGFSVCFPIIIPRRHFGHHFLSHSHPINASNFEDGRGRAGERLAEPFGASHLRLPPGLPGAARSHAGGKGSAAPHSGGPGRGEEAGLPLDSP